MCNLLRGGERLLDTYISFELQRFVIGNIVHWTLITFVPESQSQNYVHINYLGAYLIRKLNSRSFTLFICF